MRMKMRPGGLVLLAATAVPAAAVTINVPADYPTVQQGLNAANPGDTVLVALGVYAEKVSFPRSGTASAPITLMGSTIGARPVLDGVGAAGCDMVRIDGRSHVRVVGFEIRNNLSRYGATSSTTSVARTRWGSPCMARTRRPSRAS
jgi:hypothetical protein